MVYVSLLIYNNIYWILIKIKKNYINLDIPFTWFINIFWTLIKREIYINLHGIYQKLDKKKFMEKNQILCYIRKKYIQEKKKFQTLTHFLT